MRLAQEAVKAKLVSESAQADATVFSAGCITALKIPGKLKLGGEPEWMHVRVRCGTKSHRYTLICQRDWLHGSCKDPDLNSVAAKQQIEYPEDVYTGDPELEFGVALECVVMCERLASGRAVFQSLTTKI